MNKSSGSEIEDVKLTKVSANLVMFEYIDQLLHQPESENAFNDITQHETSNSVQEKSHVEPQIQSIANQKPVLKTTFKEPSIKPYIQINLLNIEQDLSSLPDDGTDEKIPVKSEVFTKTVKSPVEKSKGEVEQKIKQPDEFLPPTEVSKSINTPESPDSGNSKNDKNNLNIIDADSNEIKSELNNGFNENTLRELSDFDCVMVKIDSLLIALPMAVLGTINKINDELTKLPGKPKWFLGVHNIDKKRRFNLIDTQDVLFSDQQKKKLKNEGTIRQFSINIFGTNWALACDEVIGSIRVENGDVQWRSETKSQLISGTIKEKMCMLINVSKLIDKVTKQNVVNDP